MTIVHFERGNFLITEKSTSSIPRTETRKDVLIHIWIFFLCELQVIYFFFFDVSFSNRQLYIISLRCCIVEQIKEMEKLSIHSNRRWRNNNLKILNDNTSFSIFWYLTENSNPSNFIFIWDLILLCDKNDLPFQPQIL